MRHGLVTLLLLAACGSKQPAATEPGDDVDGTHDAGAAVVTAPPDAAPPSPVPPQVRSTDVAALRVEIAATEGKVEKLILLGQLAEALWAWSCPEPVDGLCLTTSTRGKKATPTCDGHAADLTPRVRKLERVEEAGEAIAEVRQLWGDGRLLLDVPEHPTEADLHARTRNTYMAEEVAAGLLIFADAQLEELFGLASPTGLDFTRAAAASQKKLDAWVTNVESTGAELRDLYEQIIADQNLVRWAPEAVVAATARRAAVFARYADQLRGLEIPKDLRKNVDGADVFCDTMGERAEEFEGRALEAWMICVDRAGELGVTGAWPDQCRRGYDTLDPDDPLPPADDGEFDKAEIRSLIKRALPKLEYCYKAVAPELVGKGTATAKIDGSGRVTSVTVAGFDDEDDQCFEEVIRSMQFPAPRSGGTVDLSWPL